MSISDTGRPGFVWDGTDWVPILAPISDGSFIGSIVAWAGTTPPPGWQLCDGGEPQSPALRALVGDTVPDLRDRFIVGASATKAKGATGGAETVALTVDQMPSHSHALQINLFPAGPSPVAAQFIGTGDGSAGKGSPDQASIVASGGGQAHNNMPPYYALAWIIKHTGAAANGLTQAEADARYLTLSGGIIDGPLNIDNGDVSIEDDLYVNGHLMVPPIVPAAMNADDVLNVTDNDARYRGTRAVATFDEMVQNGVWTTPINAPGNPLGASDPDWRSWIVEVSQHSPDWVRQVAWLLGDVNSGDSRNGVTWERRRDGGSATWSTWYRSGPT